MSGRPAEPRRSIARHVAAVASDHPVLGALVLVVVFTAIFLAFPGLDLWVSGLFYDDPKGFTLGRAVVPRALRDFGDLVGLLVVSWLVLQLILKLARPEQESYVRPSSTLFLLTTLIAGPALLVNVFFKNNWGRPRPRDLDQFGGDLPFVDIWQITDHCYSNCSFVSGEASFAFWMTGFALVVPRRYRFPVAVVTITYASLLSVNRILFGGHFLSDVLISIALTLLVMAIGYRLFIASPPAWLENDRIEAALTRFGLRLQGRSPKG